MLTKRTPDNGHTKLSTTTPPPTAQAQREHEKGGKNKKPDKTEEKVPMTFNFSPVSAKKVKCFIGWLDVSSSDCVECRLLGPGPVQGELKKSLGMGGVVKRCVGIEQNLKSPNSNCPELFQATCGSSPTESSRWNTNLALVLQASPEFKKSRVAIRLLSVIVEAMLEARVSEEPPSPPKIQISVNSSNTKPQLPKHSLVVVPGLKTLLKRNTGFLKKRLAHDKLDLCSRCQFSCSYCSTNRNQFHCRKQEVQADCVEAQHGVRVRPIDDPSMYLTYPDVIEQLERELSTHKKSSSRGRTLIFGMTVDNFGPHLEKDGVTKQALSLLLDKTEYRIRVLTKSAVVGKNRWVEFFSKHPDRFIVGLSTGTVDDGWAQGIEVGTSQPSARIRALHRLQDAGVPTFGMLCPIFPDVLLNNQVDELVHQIRPSRCEHIWAEPYNDRSNWKSVQAGYAEGSEVHKWMQGAFGDRNGSWDAYAAQLYAKLAEIAAAEGWSEKLVYMLYESRISADYVDAFVGADGIKPGVQLQSLTDEGFSKNPHFRKALGQSSD